MEDNSYFVLSNYQRAMLNEMGISSWQVVNEQQPPSKIENKTHRDTASSSKMTSKVDALDKLKQLKAQTQTTVVTDSVLVALSPSNANFQVFTDVLIALGLETKQQKYISTDQLNQFSKYPLVWIEGETINFNHKQLTTPALSELLYPDTKKLLWQQLHRAFFIKNI
jgi:DNA polymerase III psi subunit